MLRSSLGTRLFVSMMNLIHLTDDIKAFGQLHSFSAYPFKKKLGEIKALLRQSEKPQQQLVKRIRK